VVPFKRKFLYAFLVPLAYVPS